MANTIYLPDGRTEVIFPGDDGRYTDSFARFLEDKMGADTAKTFRSIIADYEADLEDAEFGDKDNEAIADGYLQMCHEARDNFKTIIDLLNATRLNRKELKRAAQNGYDALNKNL